MAEKTFTQLVAPGVTPAVDVDAVNNHVFQIKLANKDTSVDVNLEGSLDGTNFFKIKAADVQYTTDGMYYLTETDLQVKYVRFSFVSEIGGTAATLDVVYLGSA